MGVIDHRLWLSFAVIWAFAEATAFFIVPDVMMTTAVLVFGAAIALRFARRRCVRCGRRGWLMWNWGVGDAEGARAFLLAVPLVGDDLLVRVRDEVAGAWTINLILGAITGAPYKIYAVEAGAAGVDPLLFALSSFVARFARFALTIGLVALGVRALRHFGAAQLAPLLLAGAWAVIYAVYTFMRLGA